jgi:hypothetical protein
MVLNEAHIYFKGTLTKTLMKELALLELSHEGRDKGKKKTLCKFYKMGSHIFYLFNKGRNTYV